MHACMHACMVSSSFDYRSDFLAPPGILFRPACPTCCIRWQCLCPCFPAIRAGALCQCRQSWAGPAVQLLLILLSAFLKRPKGRVGLSLVIPQVLRDHSELSINTLSTLHSLMQVASWLADMGGLNEMLVLMSHWKELFSKLLGLWRTTALSAENRSDSSQGLSGLFHVLDFRTWAWSYWHFFWVSSLVPYF